MLSINKYTLFFFICALFSVTVLSQNKKIDSLKNELARHTKKDTTRVNLLHDFAYAHFRKDLDTTKLYLDKAQKLSDSLQYTEGIARVLFAQGRLENMKANYTKSLALFKQALQHYEAMHDKKRIANVYIAFGITHSDLSEYDDALKNYQKALDIHKELDNKREIVTCFINIANVYSEIGKYNEAITNFKEALLISETINDNDGISYVLSNLGIVYARQGNYPLAIENYTKSLHLEKKMGNTLGIARMLHNLADVYTSIHKYNKALAYHKKSLNYLANTDYKTLITANNSNIGTIYLKQKKYNQALEYFNTSLKTSQEISSFKQITNNLIDIGNIYSLQHKPVLARKYYSKAKDLSKQTKNKRLLAASLLGIAETFLKEKKYKKALSSALEGQQIAKALDLLELQKTAADILTDIYQQKGQYKKAFESHQAFKTLNDSLFNKENIEKITQLEYEYKYKQAIDSASIRELKLTKTVLDTSQNLKKSQRNLFLGVIAFLITLILLGAIIFILKLRNEKAKTQNALIEQKLLRSQMTPHFIFNSLSVLQGMILNQEEKKSVVYLSKFSKLLRLTLENSRDKTVMLSQELDAVENYLALQNLETNNYQYNISVSDTIDTSQYEIPPMLIQPFVENAIEHAFTDQHQQRNIQINLRLSGKNLICTITDNGIGIAAQPIKKQAHKHSLSTAITSERLQLLSKDFNRHASVTVEDRKTYNEQGTKVTLIIPYKRNNGV